MAIQVHAANQTTTSSPSPRTVSTTGVVNGDLIILALCFANSIAAANITVPSGFTLIANSSITDTPSIYLYAKVASSEAGSYSISWTGGGDGEWGLLSLYSDLAVTLVIDAASAQKNASGNRLWPSVTAAIANEFLACFAALTTNTGTTPHAGMTERLDLANGLRVYLMTQTVSSAGATGTRTGTGTASVSSAVSLLVSETLPPNAPSGLTATAITASRIDLAWMDNATTEDSYSVEQSSNGTTGWSEIATPAANAISYSVTSLAANTSYWFRVRALNAGGYSSYSNIAHALTLLALAPVSQPRLFLLNPDIVFAAQVNLPDPAEYPISFIAYDNVTTGDYTDIEDGMTLLLGSAPGLDDLGCQRVRGTQGVPATTISIFVGRSSRGIRDGELTLVDNAYITVLNEFLPWAKMSFIDADGRIFKDSIIEVGDNTTHPPPVANFGESYAATINGDDVIIVHLPGVLSFAVADGATITDYLWDIKDGELLVGSSLTDASIDVAFPAGYRYPSLTVTDSNGKSHTTRRLIVADDPDNRISFDGFAIDNIRITDGGQTLSIRVLEDMPQATYSVRAQALIWDSEPMGAANRDHMLIVGWLGTEESTISAGKTGLLRDTTLTILDIGAKLDLLPGFPQSIADDATRDKSETSKTPEITWNYGIKITMDWYIHYLLYWHSTALEMMNFVWSGTGSAFRVIIKSSDGESLWQQVKRTAAAMVPGYVLTCDQAGGIAVVPDPMLQEISDRTAVVQVNLTEDDFSDIRISRNPAPTTHWLRTGAILVQVSVLFNDDGSVFLPTVFSIAPGDTPGQGLGEVDDNEQLAESQTTLNNASGQRYARLNAPITSLVLTLVQDDSAPHSVTPWRSIEPALKQWVTLTLSAQYAAQRGLTFTTLRCLPKEVNIRYNISKTATTRTVELTLEPETSGPPAATKLNPQTPAVGEDPVIIPDPIPPPDDGLITGQDLVAGIGKFGVYRTFNFTNPSGSGGPTWDFKDLTGSDEMLTWVVDPFSPGYAPGATSGTVDGWAASATKLYRLADLFGTTPAATAVITFATTALWRTIQGSFGTYFVEGDNPWLICVSYYGSAGGHTGTWANYSVDGGATWSAEVQVSAFYDSGGAVNPIALFMSPRTPGLAYTAAHIATANPGVTHGYKTVNYGATWTEMTATEDAVMKMPGFGVSTHSDKSAYSYLGAATSQSYTLSATSMGTTVQNYTWIAIHPPKNAKRIVLNVDWRNQSTKTGGLGSQGAGLSVPTISGYPKTGTNNFSQAPVNGGEISGSFTLEYVFTAAGSGDWVSNREAVELSAPSSVSPGYLEMTAGADASAGNTRTTTITVVVTCTEIELDDGTTYTPTQSGVILPVHGQAGEIHYPYEDNADESIVYYGALNRTGNRQFDLKRFLSGTLASISPNDGSRDYGVNHGQFGIRAYDSDRQKMVLAGTGNDTSSSSLGDKQGVWVSINAGGSWIQIVAPTTSTEAYSAAFGGDDSDVIYVWGPASFIKYSSNFGSSLDDRSGNLTALSATHLIGIAGGPTP